MSGHRRPLKIFTGEGRVTSTERFAGRSWAHWTEPEFVQVGESEVAFRRGGEGETVLYLHGAGLTMQWLPFHTELAKHFDVVAPEHPGFGDSTLPEHFRDFSDFVLHYDEFIDLMGLGKVHLVGSSLGGRIAAHLAATYPHRFESVTLIAPAGFRGAESPPDSYRQTPEEALECLTNGRAADLAEYFETFPYPESALHAYAESTTRALLTFTNRFDRQLEQRLWRVKRPTLVLVAEEDRVLGEGAAERYVDFIPGANLVTVKGPAAGIRSSHVMHLEQAELVVSHIVDFIRDAHGANQEGGSVA